MGLVLTRARSARRPPPPPVGPVLPRRLPTGLGARTIAQAAVPANLALLQAGPGGFTALEWDWREAQPTSPNGLNEAAVLSIVADMNRAWAWGLPVLLRIRAGYYAPDWVRALAGGDAVGGGMLWYTNDGNIGTGPPAPSDPTFLQNPRPMPCWWDPVGYVANYVNFLAAIEAEPRIIDHPALGGITISGPMTQYAEPLMRKFQALLELRQVALANGYTAAADWATFQPCFDAHAAYFSQHGVAAYFSLNDWCVLNANGTYTTGQTDAITLQAAFDDTLGWFAVNENNSLLAPATIYLQIYQSQRDAMVRVPNPNGAHYQTETDLKHEAKFDASAAHIISHVATAEMAFGWGAHAVEIANGAQTSSVVTAAEVTPTSPVGLVRWTAPTVAWAAAQNTQGLANAAGRHQYQAAVIPLPPTVRLLSGVASWTNPQSQSQASIASHLAPAYIAGISVFMRWDQLTTDGVTYDWVPFDRTFAECATAGKPAALMIIHGNLANGLPAYVTAGLPADETVTADGGTFACFWSVLANQRASAFRAAIAARYGTNPWFYQMRVTTHWSTHGEPWFQGGAAGLTAWLAKWNVKHTYNGVVYSADQAGLTAAYQQHEKDVWAEFAATFPAYISLSQAGGDAFNDVNGSLLVGDPNRHPDRLATWGAIRATHGARATFQFNGVNATSGASGYGEWMPAAFGPTGVNPGRIGGQPVGGVTSGLNPMTAAQFETMLTLLQTRGNSFFECYGADVQAAIAGATADGLSIRASLNGHITGWQA